MPLNIHGYATHTRALPPYQSHRAASFAHHMPSYTTQHSIFTICMLPESGCARENIEFKKLVYLFQFDAIQSSVQGSKVSDFRPFCTLSVLSSIDLYYPLIFNLCNSPILRYGVSEMTASPTSITQHMSGSKPFLLFSRKIAGLLMAPARCHSKLAHSYSCTTLPTSLSTSSPPPSSKRFCDIVN